MIKEEVATNDTVVTGTFPINSFPIDVLFDFDASDSFIAPSIVEKLGLKPSDSSYHISITLPS